LHHAIIIIGKAMNFFKKIYLFYHDGFTGMTVGKKLWIIVIIKLFIMFFVLKLFFFPNQLKKNFDTDDERGAHVQKQLIDRK